MYSIIEVTPTIRPVSYFPSLSSRLVQYTRTGEDGGEDGRVRTAPGDEWALGVGESQRYKFQSRFTTSGISYPSSLPCLPTLTLFDDVDQIVFSCPSDMHTCPGVPLGCSSRPSPRLRTSDSPASFAACQIRLESLFIIMQLYWRIKCLHQSSSWMPVKSYSGPITTGIQPTAPAVNRFNRRGKHGETR